MLLKCIVALSPLLLLNLFPLAPPSAKGNEVVTVSCFVSWTGVFVRVHFFDGHVSFGACQTAAESQVE